jgi:hypothetical protein
MSFHLGLLQRPNDQNRISHDLDLNIRRAGKHRRSRDRVPQQESPLFRGTEYRNAIDRGRYLSVDVIERS